MSRKLTYDNVYAMLEKMVENAEYGRKQTTNRDVARYLDGKIKGYREVQVEIGRARDGYSSLLDCSWLKDAAE